MRYDLKISMNYAPETVSSHTHPLWVRWVSSEGLLMFGMPFVGWAFIALLALFLTPDVRSFRFTCSFIWCGFDFLAVVMLFANTILRSVVNNSLNCDVSTKKPFLYFYVLAEGLSLGKRKLVLLLGWSKVVTLSVISFALWGGFLIIGIWLPTIAHS